MDIKKLIAFGAITISSLLANAYATTAGSDTCSKIPGTWQGIYTLKNQSDCKAYNGCTHLVMADITYLSDNKYQVNLYPGVGTGGKFELTCDNGVITSPVNPGNKSKVSCNEVNHCFVIYDDPRLTSEMMKA